MITTQQLTRYYDVYRDSEITFTKDIIKSLRMDPRQLYIKCNGSQWPCIINSSTFQQAKIILGVKGGAFQEISKKDATVSLRFSFYQVDGQLMTFFISGKVSSIASYGDSKELVLVNIQYTQRPPEDFIELLGNMLDSNANAQRMKDEHIAVTADSCRKLGIPKKECVVSVDGVPRRGILQELSFGGTKVMLLGVAKFSQGKAIDLSLEFDDPHETVQLKGIITSTSDVEGRKDIFAANVTYNEEEIPLAYKIHINNYMNTVHKAEMEKQARDEKAAVQAQQKSASNAAAQKAQ